MTTNRRRPTPEQRDTSAPPKTKFIDKRELLRRIPVSFQTIWHRMNDGTFPRSRNIGGKAGWVESEVDAWMAARPLQKLKCDVADGRRASRGKANRAGDLQHRRSKHE